MNEPNENVAKTPKPLTPNEDVQDLDANPKEHSDRANTEKTIDENEKKTSFEQLAISGNVGIIREFIDFLFNNKKWWLTPIILVLLLVGVMIALTTSGAAPFLYTFW